MPIDLDAPTAPLMPLIVRGLYWIDESIQAVLVAKGFTPFPRTKSMILNNVLMGVTRPSMIARNLGISRQAIHQTLNELVDEKIIEIVKDPKDGRARIVQIREDRDVQDFLNAAIDTHRIVEDALKERLSPKAVELLKEALLQDWGAPLTINDASRYEK